MVTRDNSSPELSANMGERTVAPDRTYSLARLVKGPYFPQNVRSRRPADNRVRVRKPLPSSTMKRTKRPAAPSALEEMTKEHQLGSTYFDMKELKTTNHLNVVPSSVSP
jgi:hypothetical protein